MYAHTITLGGIFFMAADDSHEVTFLPFDIVDTVFEALEFCGGGRMCVGHRSELGLKRGLGRD
jgi:hypothetical protein